ncbi:UNVERIFIED_CONTAM: hypothetical protein FKN15_053748 [Acipenser sinensis]
MLSAEMLTSHRLAPPAGAILAAEMLSVAVLPVATLAAAMLTVVQCTTEVAVALAAVMLPSAAYSSSDGGAVHSGSATISGGGDLTPPSFSVASGSLSLGSSHNKALGDDKQAFLGGDGSCVLQQ